MKTTNSIQALILTGLFCLTLLPFAFSQNKLDSLETQLDQSFGKDKLVLLNELIPLHLAEQNTKEALRYARLATSLAETIISADNQLIQAGDHYLKPLSFLQLGQVNQQLGKYADSKVAYEKALTEAQLNKTPDIAKSALQGLRDVTALEQVDEKQKKGFLGRAIRDIGVAIDKTSDDLGIVATLKLAKMHENNQNYEKAAKKYEQVINQLRDQGDWEQVEELREHLAEILALQGNIPGAVIALSELKQEKQKENDDRGAAVIQNRIDEVKLRPAKPPIAPPVPVLPQDIEIANAEKQALRMRGIAERAENNQDFQASLNYYKQYLTIEQTLAEQERLQELTLLEKAHQIERQEQEITLLRQNDEISQLNLTKSQVELERQLVLKRSLVGGLALSGMLAFSLFFLYRNKQRDHQKLGVAYQDLESTQIQLKSAEKRIKSLLNQQLSGAVANELLTGTGVSAVQRKFVCIMFLDIRNFTPYVEKLSPEEIIEYQNKVLGFMIDTVHKRKGIVNQILGDGFMATFGAPVSAGNDCEQAYLAAEEIIRTVKEKSESGEIPPTRIGIGLHAGQVVAGNVGTRDRKQYSITGNPVIIAARLEQLNKEFGSTMVISKEVCDHLPKEVKAPMAFSPVPVKGRSEPVEIATV
ncbi:adenylate/guanylate cyclase domain-containing protein [Flavilitoribacter nigricans]|uniref:Guanylate cyclase domain-containing protein n=1 Tax=Flavilitoribacter nigricans (strain ATCC 23147 / DSM 23189 / NBRC 102662 / NCIMB 1420 / SS-2) TaxID=1122177 RepID=A0A2D0N8J8_FLAN2|nr:adenylate/guanylate cyclase domain-containing protein [Flavilitoribacter nigricans]PHN04718.1 hypothetical protein CRP01_19580 [Flavilitoribacter nigricans DSM 23189 = NBRC 102662]